MEQFIKFIYPTIGFLFTLSISAGCTGNVKYKDETSYLDSIVIDSSGIEKTEEKATIKFSDKAEALDYIENSTEREKYEQGIIPKILRQDFTYGSKLLANEYDGFIIVDKCEMTVSLYDKYGRVKKSYKMACAKRYGSKHKKADSRTPDGFFTLEGVYDSTDWLFTDDDGKTSEVKGQFGPRFLRLKCPNTSQIGIHGTVAPWSLGKRVSHGCIRIDNENIIELAKLVTPGMPIIVNPGPRDNAVNIYEGYSIPMLRLGNRPNSFYEYKGNVENLIPKDALQEKHQGDTIPETISTPKEPESAPAESESEAETSPDIFN